MMPYNFIPFNQNAIDNVKKVNKEIEEAIAEDEVDKAKLQKLYEKQLWFGMQMNTGYRRQIQNPY